MIKVWFQVNYISKCIFSQLNLLQSGSLCVHMKEKRKIASAHTVYFGRLTKHILNQRLNQIYALDLSQGDK